MPKPDPQSTSQSTIETKIERSSLGTADARRMRARTSTAIAQAIVSRAAHGDTAGKTGRRSGR